MAMSKEDGPQFVADLCASWLDAFVDRVALSAQPLCQQSALSRFAGAVDPVEHHKQRRHGRRPHGHADGSVTISPRTCRGLTSSGGKTNRSASRPVAGALTSNVAPPTATSTSRSPSYTMSPGSANQTLIRAHCTPSSGNTIGTLFGWLGGWVIGWLDI